MRHSIISLAAASAAAMIASPAFAVVNFPPPGSHSFVALYEIDSGQHVCQLQCAIASSLTQNVALNPVTFADGVGNFISGSGSTTGGTALHGFVSGRDGAELDVVFDDTYTVHGGTSPFMITTTMTIDGVLSTIPVSPTLNFLIAGNFNGRIGQLDINPAALIPTVDPFASASTGAITLIGAAQSQAASLVVSYSQMVNPGQVFDLAYEMEAAFAVGSIDVSHTATIGFDLPDGVFLTTASGATFGDAGPPSTGVPEPAAWSLMIAGFGLAGAALRRRVMA